MRADLLKTCRRKLAFSALIGGLSMIYLDKTIVPITLVSVQKDFNASDCGLEWCINSYLLTITLSTLIAGKLGDRVGHKAAFLLGTSLFFLGSFFCAISPNLSSLIMARVVKGLGAAFILTSQPALLGSIFPSNQIGRAMGFNTSISSVFMMLGPLIGGYLVELISWRSIFWMILLVSAISIFLAVSFIPHAPSAASDVKGEDFSSFSLFKNRIFIAICVLVGLSQVFVMTNVYRAIYFQTVLEYSPSKTGWMLFFSCVPVFFVSQIAGVLFDKIGPKIPIAVGFILLFYSFLSIAFFPSDPWILFPLITFGVALPLILTPAHSAVFRAVPPTQFGIAFGMLGTLRAVSGTVGVLVISWVRSITQNHYLKFLPEKESSIMSFSTVHFFLASLLILEVIAVWFLYRQGKKFSLSQKPEISF